MKIEEAVKIDLRQRYSKGDTVKLLKDCRTRKHKFKKDEEFIVEDVKEAVLYLFNKNGGLTIHRYLLDYIEKA